MTVLVARSNLSIIRKMNLMVRPINRIK